MPKRERGRPRKSGPTITVWKAIKKRRGLKIDWLIRFKKRPLKTKHLIARRGKKSLKTIRTLMKKRRKYKTI